MGKKLNVAVIQMVSGHDIAANYDQAITLLARIFSSKCVNIVVFPENFLCFGSVDYFKVVSEIERYIVKFSLLAKKYSTTLVLGTVPFRDISTPETGKVLSRCLVINNKGECESSYDKMHLFDVDVQDGKGEYRESDKFLAGDKLSVVDLGDAKLGLSVCYDIRFPHLYQKLVENGANVLIVPAAFTKKTGQAHWEILLRARAIETQCFLLAANQGGKHDNGLETWGQSMIISPWGDIIAQCPIGIGYCVAEIDIDDVFSIRKRMPISNHKRTIS